MNQRIVIMTLCLVLSGCTMAPKYERPQLPVAEKYQIVEDKDVQTAVDIGWRDVVNDLRLQKLIEIALHNNRDMRVAALHVELLRAQYRVGSAYGFPTITGTANGSKQKDVTSEGTEESGKYSLRLGATSYEIDLFGRVRSLKRQVLEKFLASEETRRGVQISLVAEVAIQYLSERALAEQLIQTQQTLKSLEEYYKVIKGSYDIGNTSELDLRSSQAQVETAKVNVASFIRQHAQAENALVLLLGQSIPEDLPEPQPFESQEILSDIAAGLPSDLITRRPDIMEAEHLLKGANANVGAARAAFFPKILLTGSIGQASIKLNDLFSGSSVWSFAPQISVPIFDAGANIASLDVARINKSIEIARYEKVIQTAFREVSDGLIARMTLEDQLQAQQALVKAQQQRYELADVRYKNGVDNYLTVLIVQQDLYRARQNLIEAQFGRMANLITLYKALGGGWDPKDLNAEQVRQMVEK